MYSYTYRDHYRLVKVCIDNLTINYTLTQLIYRIQIDSGSFSIEYHTSLEADNSEVMNEGAVRYTACMNGYSYTTL